MLCEKCGINTATFHYTEVVNGIKSEHHLCKQCVVGTDMSYYTSFFDNDAQSKNFFRDCWLPRVTGKTMWTVMILPTRFIVRNAECHMLNLLRIPCLDVRTAMMCLVR